METKVLNRTPMTCPKCFHTDTILVTHLRRKCMRFNSDSEIKATLAEAKQNLLNIASHGLAINYKELEKSLCNKKCTQTICDFLKKRGFIIYNEPVLQSPENGDLEAEENGGKKRRREEEEDQEADENIAKRTRQEVYVKDEIVIVLDAVPEVPDEVPEEVPEVPDAVQQEKQEEDEVSIEENNKKINWTDPLRKKMAEKGLYMKHSLTCKPISEFASYLSRTLGVKKFKQEVENISRYLYFMDNMKPSLKFLYNIRKTNEYFTLLLEIGNTNQTVYNYLKSIKRYVRYLTEGTDMALYDREIHHAASVFKSQLNIFQNRLSKGISKETILKKEKQLAQKLRKPSEMQEILAVAAPSFKEAVGKAGNGGKLSEKEKLTVLYYLECLIVLNKLQRPGVVQNMTVSIHSFTMFVFLSKISISILISILYILNFHKTAANQLALLALTVEEEKWFEIYHKHIRPTWASNGDIKNFFISSTGKPIHNVSLDVSRFHENYYRFNVTPETSQAVRRNAETFVSSKCKDSAEKERFAKYLAHSNQTAERVYREKTLVETVNCSKLIPIYEDEQPSTSKEEPTTLPRAEVVAPTDIPRTKAEEFEDFLEKHPLSLNEEPPPLKVCVAASPDYGQSMYDRWRKRQNKMREDHIIGLLQDHRPSELEVKGCIQRQRWKRNLPRIKEIIDNWKKT
ncbi:uncharacterized protein [Engystomops pustulosus]|uniref:uncharacterized protein n=1 Tax=Engystomops pustulosus TaxID=76066 RepID=UPI003AFA6155